jgi:glycerol-3-phosphate dehydrogenase
MNRTAMLRSLESQSGPWDICIIGGGATGLGAALDASSRGFKTILFERFDFAKGTSSRSTKLVHGGVRYLQQGNIKLVLEALRERGTLKKNAPHLVKNQSFIVPNYKWWEGPYYGIGLKVYDWMAGRLGLGASQILSKEETLQLAPTLEVEGLRGGVLYFDGQFDDARLAINIAQTAWEQGATLVNYCQVEELQKTSGKITSVLVHDSLQGKRYQVSSKAFINATGVFTDAILQLDDPASEPLLAPSQGVHIVLDKEFLPGDAAILVPHTDDGRVLFAVPWHNKVVVGTTDTPVQVPSIEPQALDQEVEFILRQIRRYLLRDPTAKDIRSVFAGLRPLVKATHKKTAEISRDHLIVTSDSGLITIAGGKWTTYRQMAEDVVNVAIRTCGLAQVPCRTGSLPIHGARETSDFTRPLYYYGTDAPAVLALIQRDESLGEFLHPALPYVKAEISWAVQQEMCMTLEDALSRRTRSLLLDARASIQAAPQVAALMARELKKDDQWIGQQVNDYIALANRYLPRIF